MAPTKPKSKHTSASAVKKLSAASAVGAPAQHNQASRKGKKAWRKNVDIEDLEEKLEGLREEERTFGLTLQKKTDGDLSHQIISQRSAVPAVYARPRKSLVSSRDKERLLRIARKDRRGPLNSIVDPSQPGAGSALLEVSEAVKQSGQYNMWSPQAKAVLDDGLKVKAPDVPNPRAAISLPAVPVPHAGTSYNPPEAAHTALLRAAHEAELRRVQEAEALEATKARFISARHTNGDNGNVGAQGMLIDKPGEGKEEDVAPTEQTQDGVEQYDSAGEDANAAAKKKSALQRKTKQQRRKAEKLRAEKHALLERTLRKRLHASVDTVKTLRKAADRTQAARIKVAAERRAKQEALLAQNGLTGQKFGKHVVREGELDVQLGEELSESLRGLQPEGNLFRDRFLNMQQRALIEPRTPVLPKKRRKIVEYEKHAWKRFV
ncbi:tumor suppressor protein Gltscr2 [Russula ochroleuca]|uniref:Ribosome biogenesis protein NOP53 n=1 Tax=Russula ochroleuca TaxID=152965 RepID=A0A9P5JWE5_9AGAM|nr:tumor suppressor protein Gltscr2 [Russula ochroleuca]